MEITNRVKETHNAYTHTLAPSSKSQKFLFEVGQFVMLGAFLSLPSQFLPSAYISYSKPIQIQIFYVFMINNNLNQIEL
jgi:hypothetical protein